METARKRAEGQFDIVALLAASHSSCYRCTLLTATLPLLLLRVLHKTPQVKVSIDAIDPCGLTPLHLAAKWGRLAIVKKLLESGAFADSFLHQVHV